MVDAYTVLLDVKFQAHAKMVVRYNNELCNYDQKITTVKTTSYYLLFRPTTKTPHNLPHQTLNQLRYHLLL